MESNVLILPASLSFDSFLELAGEARRLQYIVIADGDRIMGVQRINTALRYGLAGTGTGVSLGEIARSDFTIAREEDVLFNVIDRMSRRRAMMAVVLRGQARIPRADHVAGIIGKEHIADCVAESIKGYGE